MIETIIQMNGEAYPFDSTEETQNVKVSETYMVGNCMDIGEEKKRFQIIKNVPNPTLINLLQIYQEQNTILHLLYQYIPSSLSSILLNLATNPQTLNDEHPEAINKLIMKNMAFELSNLADFLASMKIKTPITYENIGILGERNIGQWKIKYYIGAKFQFWDTKREDLADFYTKEKKSVLTALEKQLHMQKRSEYLPNFIIRGSRLIFTDELSEATQRKPKSQFRAQDRFRKSQYGGHFNKYPQSGESVRSKGKWGSKAKQKRHKNSENFEHNIFEQQKLNKSFDEESQNISVTQTKSMKIQIEQQKDAGRRRKNSYKFRITTFQQISIDQEQPEQSSGNNYPYPFYPSQSTSPEYSQSYHPNEEEKKAQEPSEGKNYRDKVNQAKAKAETLLNQYFKSKNKKSYSNKKY